MDFEFNFGEQTLARGIEKNDTMYASVAGIALPLSHEELVFMDKDTGTNNVMTQQVLHALSLCQQFKPLDQHILSISQAMPELSNQTQAIQQVVNYLIKSNLLVKEQDWKEKLSIGSTQSAIVDAGIVIRTYDNPKLLNRMLQSLVEYQKKFASKYTVQIYTSSNSEKIEKEIESIAKLFKKDLNINIYGSTWQNQFVKMLKKEYKGKEQTIDWLLTASDSQYHGGKLWNFALLNNAGKKFLFFDDDTIFEPRILGEETKTIELRDYADLDVGFALSLTEIRNSSSEYNQDVLKDMINNCGQTVGNYLSTTDNKLDSIKSLNLIELERLNSNSVIKTVGNGTWGSPRSNSNYWLYYLEGKQKEEFWKTREIYLDNIEASNLLHYTENHRFMSLGNFAPSAIDNSSMTPFASPNNQKEDYFYNAITLFCYPDQVMLHCPFMVGYLKEKSGIQSNQNHIAITPNFNKFIADFALTLIQSTDAVSPKLRLKTLANYILGLADSQDKNIHNRLKEYLSQIRSDMVLNMQHQLTKSPNAPVYWQADVRELIEANGKELLQNNPPNLSNWGNVETKQDCIDMAKQELIEVAQAMELWPELWEFCQTNK